MKEAACDIFTTWHFLTTEYYSPLEMYDNFVLSDLACFESLLVLMFCCFLILLKKFGP